MEFLRACGMGESFCTRCCILSLLDRAEPFFAQPYHLVKTDVAHNRKYGIVGSIVTMVKAHDIC